MAAPVGVVSSISTMRLGQRNALEDLGRGGRGQGHPAVGGLDPALAGRNGAGLEAIHAQQVQPHRRADDVDDRIDRADLVKMDLREVDAVHLGLGLAQPQEDPLGQVFLAGGQAAGVDDGLDVVPVPVGVLVRGVHLGVGGPEASLAHGLERDMPGKTQARHGLLDGPGIDPGVHQSAQGHVSRDAAEAVEIADSHSDTPCARSHRWLTWRHSNRPSTMRQRRNEPSAEARLSLAISRSR